MEKIMLENFSMLKERVDDCLEQTDLELIRYELKKIKEPLVLSGVGGSSVVSEMGSNIIRDKNKIMTYNAEPRDFVYNKFYGFKNVMSCSYSGNNYGVDLSFNNDMKKYSLSSNSFCNSDITYLQYKMSLKKEKSFISLAATLIPVSIFMDYYLDGDHTKITKEIIDTNFNFDVNCDAFEIFSGIETKTASKYLESTIVEAGLGFPIIHDKYSYCHGRSTLSKNYNNIAIYYNKNKELDKLLLEEIKLYYKSIIVIDSKYEDNILDDYQMLIQSMYLTKYIAERKKIDLSGVDYNPVVKKLYNYKGNI